MSSARSIPANGGSVTWQGDPEGHYPTGARIVRKRADGTEKHIQMNIHYHWPLFKDGATIMAFVCTCECEGERGSEISGHLYRDAHAFAAVHLEGDTDNLVIFTSPLNHSHLKRAREP